MLEVGADVPLRVTKSAKKFGCIPAAVTDVCTLTWICEKHDMHATTSGYGRIASPIAARYSKFLR